MKYDRSIVEKIISLRNKGHSINELARKFDLSADTVSRWCSKVVLNEEAQKIIQDKKYAGQKKGLETLKLKRNQKLNDISLKAQKIVENSKFGINDQKILCSLLYWAEGAKSRHDLLTFVNSDPKMIKLFLNLLRNCFTIDESKFRILIHLHEYHNEVTIKQFWSGVTGVPISQFNKSFLKVNTQIRKRENYTGTISVRYYDSEVAQELFSIYNAVAARYVRGVSQW